MKTRYFIHAFVLTLFGITGTAQQMETESISVRYIQLPSEQLPDGITSYATERTSCQSLSGLELAAGIESELTLSGYTASDQNPDVVIRLKVLQGLIPGKVEVRTAERTDYESATGGETTRNTATRSGSSGSYTQVTKSSTSEKEYAKYNEYSYVVQYTSPKMHIAIVSKQGEILAEHTFGGESKTTTYGNNHRSASALSSAWRNSQDGFFQQLETEHIQPAILQSWLNRFCLHWEQQTIGLHYPKRWKKFDYTDLEEAVTNSRVAYELLAAERIEIPNTWARHDHNAFAENLMLAVNTWEKAIEEYSARGSKKRVNYRIALDIYLNLVTAYTWLDEFDRAQSYLDEIASVLDGFGIKDYGEGYQNAERTLHARKELFAKNAWRGAQLHREPEVK